MVNPDSVNDREPEPGEVDQPSPDSGLQGHEPGTSWTSVPMQRPIQLPSVPTSDTSLAALGPHAAGEINAACRGSCSPGG